METPRHEIPPDSVKGQTPGAEAAAAPGSSTLKPLLLRSLVGAVAVLGVSAIGALSMLAGLDGAHASPPEATSAWLAASASAMPTSAASPSSGANGPSAGPTNASPRTNDGVTSRAPGDTSTNNDAPTSSGAATTSDDGTASSCPRVTADGKIILNRARVEELRKIPGIGPKRAEAILALRTKLKRFKRASELLRVKGIGPKSLVRMQARFVLDDPNKDADATACAAPQ
ncbi:MAG: helix-hairpin-helix domain-containing protein [Polyangiaceae bacterium]